MASSTSMSYLRRSRLLGISIDGTAAAAMAHYVVRLTFSARDASGGPVSFLVTARSSTLLAAKYGIAAHGTSSVALDVQPAGGRAHSALEIEATDQVGNEPAIVRTRASKAF